MSKIVKSMDGNEAAAYASYAFTEVAAIYPITPSSPMAEAVDVWAANGRKNIFGQTVKLVEMQSEGGAVSSMHGALEAGTLSTSYSASQGLLLMVPTMFRIAGQLKPGVIHVSARNIASHAVSIFSEHSDVMACRQTGFAMLASSSVQECMDLGAVAHLSAIKGHVPFLHFFDGFRTSHEVQKIDCLDYDDLAKLVDYTELKKFRKHALNPDHPSLITTGQNSDIYFQGRESCNPYYNNLPDIVQDYMNQLGAITGRNYKLFQYYGAPDAERVIVAMASVSGTARETVDYLIAKGEKVGYLEVHLYRPFSFKHFFEAIPGTVKVITVMDKTKEPGALGEPLYEDVCAAFNETDIKPVILACRFGLAGKDTAPAHIAAVYNEMLSAEPKRHFTIGINDDVTGLSLQIGDSIDVVPEGTISCKFWGLGSDGTVGANKNTIKVIGDHTDMNVQAYFEYDGKKSGGVTRSHLRFGTSPIQSAYLVNHADFVACHNQSYIDKYDMVTDVKPGGSFLLSCIWNGDELERHLPNKVKRYIAQNNLHFYTIDAAGIAKEIGLGNRTNTVLQAAFFKIANIIPIEKAVEYMKGAIQKTYNNKGEKVLNMNFAAVDQGVSKVCEIAVPESWKSLSDNTTSENSAKDEFLHNILEPIARLKGDDIPVSAFVGREDGSFPQGTSKYEKRGIAIDVPVWKPDNCIQCNQCAYVCPHATVRPFLLNQDEDQGKPEKFATIAAKGKDYDKFTYRIQINPLDCTGCGSCASVCPSKEKALVMEPMGTQLDEMQNWVYATSLEQKVTSENVNTVKDSQFLKPLLEYSGACAGCCETPYAKLVTQLYGDRMYVATATGCAVVWSASAPSFPYTMDNNGHGPASGSSLFENNAEYGLGMLLAVNQLRDRLRMNTEKLMEMTADAELKSVAQEWLDHFEEGEKTTERSQAYQKALKTAKASGEEQEIINLLLEHSDQLRQKSVWLFGGDGWAYDIGFGGLDHVLASGDNVNILVFDTEIYSNTGGQSSKATQAGAVAYFAASGKKTKKKDLGMMAMSYGDVYVAQVAMGANPAQLLKAVKEAEAYPGPSLIIAYSPCISHGLKVGMSNAMQEMKRAVEVGYWQLYRYNPLLKIEGKNPFILDSKAPSGDFSEFLRGEVRFSSLERLFPGEANRLFAICEENANERYKTYAQLANQQ